MLAFEAKRLPKSKFPVVENGRDMGTPTAVIYTDEVFLVRPFLRHLDAWGG